MRLRMDLHVWTRAFFVSTLFSFHAFSEQHSSAARVDFDTYLKEVSEKGLEAKFEDLEVRSARESENRAGRLMDPEINIGRQNVPIMKQNMSTMSTSENRSLSPSWNLQLTQNFPWPGTLGHESSAAEKRTKLAKTGAQLSKLERVSGAGEFFVDLVAAEKNIAIEKLSLDEASRVLKWTENRFSLGKSSHHEVIQSRIEREVLATNLATLMSEFLNMKDQAAQLMGRARANEIEFVFEYPKLIQKDEQADLYKESLDAERGAVVEDLQAERKRTLPSFMLSLMLMQEDTGMVMGGAMVGVKVPIFSHGVRRSLESEKEIALTRAAQSSALYEQKKVIARAQNDRRISQIHANLKVVDASLIPAAQSHLEQVGEEYAQGKAQLSLITEARRNLLRLRQAQNALRAASAKSELLRVQIEAGLLDNASSYVIPQIPQTQGMNAMSGMNEMPSSKMKMKTKSTKKPTQKMQKPNMNKMGEDDMDKKPMSRGMGM